MVRGIIYYLLIWLVVSATFYGYSKLTKRERMTVIRSIIYGLITASVALGIVLVIVYLF